MIIVPFYQALVSFPDGNTKMGGAHLTEQGKFKLKNSLFP